MKKYLIILSAAAFSALLCFSSIVWVEADNQPVGTIEINPAVVRQNETFELKVSGEDDNGLEYVCYKEENEKDWTCYNCRREVSCSYFFERSESDLGIYKYYGSFRNTDNEAFNTDPLYIELSVQEDPIVSTISVNLEGEKAVLHGYLNYSGKADLINVYFEWGETEEYGQKTEAEQINSPGYFRAEISNLSLDRAYHFRAAAENQVGIDFGRDMLTTELIKNGSFEDNSLTGWQKTSKGHYRVTEEDVFQDYYAGLFGFKDFKGSGISAFYQTVAIPEKAGQVFLSAAYNFYTYDYCNNDFFRIRIRDINGNILQTLKQECCPAYYGNDCRRNELVEFGWKEFSKKISDYAGEDILISFEIWRNDNKRHSWAVIDAISLSYLPAVSPQVQTDNASHIHTGTATLNGKLIDTGQSDQVEVWFVWDKKPHQNWQDYKYSTGSFKQEEAGDFVISIGNLDSDTDYHFRAVAKNNAGLSSGENKSFTTLYAATGGWRIPDYHIDVENRWSYEQQAYDWDTATRAVNDGYQNAVTGWRGFLEFHLNEPILSNKLRISGTGQDSGSKETVSDIYIRYQGNSNWVNIFEGVLPENHRFVELPYTEGMVEAARIRRDHPEHPDPLVAAWVSTIGEIQFYEVPEEPITYPTAHTLEAVRIEENSAILKGIMADDGGEPCQTRFKYWPAGQPDNISYTEWDSGATKETSGWASGEEFGRIVTGLTRGETYYFLIQAKNSATDKDYPVEGEIKNFVTRPADIGWVSPTGSEGTWDYEYYAYDNIQGTFAALTRSYGAEVWSPWLVFSRPAIFSDKIRFRLPDAKSGDENIIEQVQVEIRVDNEIKRVYNSPNFNRNDWTEVDISNYTFKDGRPLLVDGARIRLRMNRRHYFPWEFDEFEFWKLPDLAEVETGQAEIGFEDEELSVKLSGQLLYLGGLDQADVWLEWREEGDIRFENKTDNITMHGPGEFWSEDIGQHLSTGFVYYFRAAAENNIGLSYGIEKQFFTTGCLPGEETICEAFKDEEGNKCTYLITCQEDGTWPRCEGECATNNDCNCQDIGASDGEAFCRDDCWCDYSNCGLVVPRVYNLKFNLPGCSQSRIPRFEWQTDATIPYDYEVRICHDSDCSGGVLLSGRAENTRSTEWSPDCAYCCVQYNQIEFGGNIYSGQVRARNAGGDWSEWLKGTFITAQNCYPFPDFLCNNTECKKLIINAQELVELSSNSTVHSQDKEIIGCSWQLPEGTVVEEGNINKDCEIKVKFDTGKEQEIIFSITDINGYKCSKETLINVRLPLPEYKEVAPES